jgi:zinc protease
VPLPRPITIETTDKVQVPKVIITMRAPEAYSQASFDLAIASYVLGSGKTSRLHKRLVFQDRLATEASAYLNDQMLGSELSVSAVARPGVTAQQIRAVLEEEVKRMAKEPPSAADIERARRVIEVGLLSSLENPASRAGRLAEWAAYTGDPDHLAETRAALAKVTPESCAKAIRAWMSLDHAVTAIVMPEGGGT